MQPSIPAKSGIKRRKSIFGNDGFMCGVIEDARTNTLEEDAISHEKINKNLGKE